MQIAQATGEMPDDIAEKINRDLLVTTPVHGADLLFVFGSRHAVDKFASAIATLWRKGLFRWLLISGGATNGGPTEASVIFEKIRSLGIPSQSVVLEEMAQNTGENVSLSMPILERQIGLRNIRSVIALGKFCASARYLMTLERYWPDVEKMLVTVNHFDVPEADWTCDPLARKRIYEEWRKLERYKRLGYIVDWNGPKN